METATKRFIKDAVKGGLRAIDPDSQERVSAKSTPAYFTMGWYTVEQALLDPTAWQAVGKVRGWKWLCHICESSPSLCSAHRYEKWHALMHHFVDHLADGMSIEESLLAIE